MMKSREFSEYLGTPDEALATLKELHKTDIGMYAKLMASDFLAFVMNNSLLAKVGKGHGPEVLRVEFDEWAKEHEMPEDSHELAWQEFLND